VTKHTAVIVGVWFAAGVAFGLALSFLQQATPAPAPHTDPENPLAAFLLLMALFLFVCAIVKFYLWLKGR